MVGRHKLAIVCPRCQHAEALLMGPIVRPTSAGPGKPIAHRYGCERCRLTFRVGPSGVEREQHEPADKSKADAEKRNAPRRSEDMLWRD